MSLWESVYIPKTPNFVDITENNYLGTDCNEFDCCNGESEISYSTHYIKETNDRPLDEEHKDIECNGFSKLNGFNDCENDRKKRTLKDSGNDGDGDDDSCIRNNNHGNEETNETVNDCNTNCEGSGESFHEDQLCRSLENISLNLNGSIDKIADSKSTIVDSDTMQTSMSSSTKTITSCVNEIELQALNSEEKNQSSKTGDNPNSEPSTPKGGKFKGHRRTHSSDGSPIKNVMKTTSYSEGMSSSAYYSRESFEIQQSKVLNNPLDNIPLINRFLSHDGLMKCEDERHQRLREMHHDYRGEIRKLQKRVELERQTRLSIAQQKADLEADDCSRRESENLDEMVK